jgi:hypothetical protein
LLPANSFILSFTETYTSSLNHPIGHVVHVKFNPTEESYEVFDSNQKVTWFMKDTMEVKQWIINSGDIVIHTVNCYLNTNDPDHPHHANGPSFNTMRKAVGQ